MKTEAENPDGLHKRYVLAKANGDEVDPKGEYFVLRLDAGGSDPIHISACRKALVTYARQIAGHIPGLAKDIVEKYGETTSGVDALHAWWGLSYAQYLTVPRSVMQSMPDEWQRNMAELLCEMDATIDWRPEEGCYFVSLNHLFDDEDGVDKKGEGIPDPLADYDRGRRRLPLRPEITGDQKGGKS